MFELAQRRGKIAYIGRPADSFEAGIHVIRSYATYAAVLFEPSGDSQIFSGIGRRVLVTGILFKGRITLTDPLL
jgi:hypothetical protein